ncbi:hypothetical protein J7E70_01935 [Variovorax paradoxus]|nr:hypothetical protein [Variovorax paradoxus]MBT2299215.1 hypothetical protein [Variovorax paradoxus]
MEKVKIVHSGRFTLKGTGQATPDGKFIATFLVTEHQGSDDLELKRSTGETCDTEEPRRRDLRPLSIGWRRIGR